MVAIGGVEGVQTQRAAAIPGAPTPRPFAAWAFGSAHLAHMESKLGP